MNSIELYINNTLCDVGSNFSVRLNRVLMKPGELNTKDAQYSYNVSLPPTPINHKVFNYANIEETRDKFNHEYNAELIINGVRVFAGKFRLSEVSRLSYKGNLYVPALAGVKGVFGDSKLNEAARWDITFADFAESVSKYNRDAAVEPQPAIFPYTLYGLPPKILTKEGGFVTDIDEWDADTDLGMSDFPPSVNVLQLIRHLFEGKDYKIGGSAFSDERLTRMYMSYRNAPEYVLPWNYGRHARIALHGEWSNVRNRRTETESYENGVFEVSTDGANLYACDLFDCQNSEISIIEDPGGNVKRSEEDGYLRTQVYIPASGYYRIELESTATLTDEPGIVGAINRHGRFYVGANSDGGALYSIRCGLKLLRDNKRGDFGVEYSRMDGAWDKDNLPQNDNSVPRYAPYFYGTDKGSLVFIDVAQNVNFIAGLQWGSRNNNDGNPSVKNWPDLQVPASQVQAAKPAVSWDPSYAGEQLTRLAIHNPSGYMRYGALEDDEETEDTGNAWRESNKYRMSLNGAPENRANRTEYTAAGSVNCIVWLEAGELLTIVDVSDRGAGRALVGGLPVTVKGWVCKSVEFDLRITPFRTDHEWLCVDTAGNGTAPMNWDDVSNFDYDSINLTGFLPVDMKIDDFLDNFCKAFNLQLSQIGAKDFELNIKQIGITDINRSINLDNLASVRDRTNTSLGLPSLYKLGFTVDQEEEGYEMTKDDGGGEFPTGATEEKTVEQKSTFSYNWFKDIKRNGAVLPLAIISKKDVWTNPPEMTPGDAVSKRYTDLALRFWYYDGLLNRRGIEFDFNGRPIAIAKVSNELTGISILDYKNRRSSILQNYFTVLTNGRGHYTEVEGYLTPDQYEALGAFVVAIFNGDVYLVAEVSGYDPQGRNKTKIKLIRS